MTDIEIYQRFWHPIAVQFIAAVIFLLIAIVILLILLLWQANNIRRSRQLQSDIALLSEMEKALEPYHKVYSQFSQDGFRLNYSTYSDVHKDAVRLLIRALTLTGVLFQHGSFDHSPVLSLHADFCIRSWLMLEEYIKEQRELRQDPAWVAPLQYLTVVSIKNRLQFKRDPLVLYHPYDHNGSFKKLEREELEMKLTEIERISKFHG